MVGSDGGYLMPEINETAEERTVKTNRRNESKSKRVQQHVIQTPEERCRFLDWSGDLVVLGMGVMWMGAPVGETGDLR